MELELNSKVAPVTGANRGIRAAIAFELDNEGMRLCLLARDAVMPQEVAEKRRKTANINVHVVSADFRDPAAPRQAVAQAVVRLGGLDLLVNNADATKRANFFTLTEEDWQDGLP